MINVIYEDNEILVCMKPAGMATESANIRDKDLISEIRSYLKDRYVGLIHRLDQPVSGLLVFAKTPAAAASLSTQLKTADLCKYYRAEVEGKMEDTGAPVLVTDFLIKDPKTSKAVIVSEQQKDAHGKPARKAMLSYEILSYDPVTDTTSLRIHLMTGRFHQIRAQLSHLGHPILKDVKYGAKKPADPNGSAGIALCAYELRFSHPKTGKQMQFSLPADQLSCS